MISTLAVKTHSALIGKRAGGGQFSNNCDLVGAGEWCVPFSPAAASWNPLRGTRQAHVRNWWIARGKALRAPVR